MKIKNPKKNKVALQFQSFTLALSIHNQPLNQSNWTLRYVQLFFKIDGGINRDGVSFGVMHQVAIFWQFCIHKTHRLSGSFTYT